MRCAASGAEVKPFAVDLAQARREADARAAADREDPIAADSEEFALLAEHQARAAA